MGNPRAEESYKDLCCEKVGLGAQPDRGRYPLFQSEDDFALMKWVVRRSSGCFWVQDTQKTSVRAFKHHLMTRGPPQRVPLHRLSRNDTEWIEKAVAEDVARGQLVKGSSLWGFPAFPTKESPDHKAIKRGRRMVVDYRVLNKVTERRFFIIPNSDGIKATVAGSSYLSVGDLKEGFNQVDNEEETSKKMAVLTASGCYLPKGLPLGRPMDPRTSKS